MDDKPTTVIEALAKQLKGPFFDTIFGMVQWELFDLRVALVFGVICCILLLVFVGPFAILF